MNVGRLHNLTTGNVVAGNVTQARSWWRRLAGLLPYRNPPPGEGLWFDRCFAIHTIGMRCNIDAIFLDGDRRVLDVRRSVSPHRLLVAHRGARAVVEVVAGAEIGDIRVGDCLALQ